MTDVRVECVKGDIAAQPDMDAVAESLPSLGSVQLVRFVLFSDQDLSVFREALGRESNLSGQG